MYVSNMIGNTGEPVKNQYVITGDSVEEYFQSYSSMIVKRTPTLVLLDEKFWDYSVTTSKYRNRFLGETTAQTKAKIKSGEYILTNLNK